jgi:hypothetical protein
MMWAMGLTLRSSARYRYSIDGVRLGLGIVSCRPRPRSGGRTRPQAQRQRLAPPAPQGAWALALTGESVR